MHIGFYQIPKEKVKDFLERYKKDLWAHMDGIAYEKQCRCPIWKGSPSSDVDNWIAEQFSVRSFYSDAYGVIGVVEPPVCVYSLFEAVIEFDEKSECDYYRETWQPILRFVDIYDKWMVASYKTIETQLSQYGISLKKLHSTGRRHKYLNEVKTEHCRRILCYKEIFTVLSKDLENNTTVIKETVSAQNNSKFDKFLSYCYEYHKMCQAMNERFD